MKLKILRETCYVGSCICALATMQCGCIVANCPELWAVAIGLVLIFGMLTAGLYSLAQRIDRAIHMTHLQILGTAQTKIAGHCSNSDRPEPRKAAN